MAGFNAFLKNNNIITGTAIPTEGNFKTGDIIVNVGPNSAIEPMWICNEGGNPGIWGPVGVGSGSIVSINSSVLISEPTNEISLASLGVGVSSKDKLLVHYNSTHLLEGVHFEISNDGSKIVKLGGGNWNPDGLENCIFALELFKGVESINGDKVVVDSKMTSITNHVVIENACNEVEIGIKGFNAGNDVMLVFKNGVNMVEGVDYEVQGGKIVSTGEVWNENGLEDYGMTFVVFKEVVEYNGDAEVKAENIADGSIGMNKLGEDVREAIEDASNIDLSGYATKEEMNGKVAQGDYNTKIAELEGRVEEAFTSANNGKQLIASAIGNPLITGNSTFNAMSEAILGYENNLRIILTDEGVSTSDEDNMDSLIAKVDSEFDRQVVPQGNANANQVLQGSTFMNSSGQLQAGTVPYLQSNIPNVTEYTANHYMTDDAVVADLSGLGGNCLYFAMPTGVYNTVGWLMSYTPNLIPENIVSGVNILGVTGNATVGSLGGRQFNSGTVTVSGGTQSINIPVGFTPSLIMGVHVDDSGYPLISVCSIYATYFTCRINGTCKNTSNGGSINGSNVVLPLQWQTYNANNTYTLTWYAYS